MLSIFFQWHAIYEGGQYGQYDQCEICKIKKFQLIFINLVELKFLHESQICLAIDQTWQNCIVIS